MGSARHANVPVTVAQDGTETIVHVIVTVNPVAPYAVTFGPASSTRTGIQWAGSLGATGYRIRVDATVVGAPTRARRASPTAGCSVRTRV